MKSSIGTNNLKLDSSGLGYKYVSASKFEDYERTTTSANLYREDEPGYLNVRQEIGDVLLSFGQLEIELERLIAKFLDTKSNSKGFIVTRLMSYSAKVALLNELAHSRASFKREPIKELVKRLQTCGKIRNIIAHAKWASMTADGFVRLDMKTDKETADLQIRYYYFDHETFHSICLVMAELQDELMDLSNIVHLVR